MLKTFKKEQISCRGGFFEEIKAIGVEKMHHIQTGFDKNTKKNQIFENFMQFLRFFRKTWWLRMLKTFSMERILCRGCFFEEIKAIGVEKMHQIRTEIDEIHENSDFWNFYAIFMYFSKNLVA